jgi:hypothetical protein
LPGTIVGAIVGGTNGAFAAIGAFGAFGGTYAGPGVGE